MKNKDSLLKIALLGSYPPPYGGISIHIQRIKNALDKKGINCVVYDLLGQRNFSDNNIFTIKNPKRWIFKYMFSSKENIIHVHTPDWRLRAIIGLMSFFGKKTIISVHGESLNDSLKNCSWLKRKFILFSLKHTSHIIANNDRIMELISSLNIPKNRSSLISAFIPPDFNKDDVKKIPEYVWDFINSHEPVLSGNAFQIKFYKGNDLYGIDLIVKMIIKLKEYYPNIGMLFCLPNIGDEKYFNKLQDQIKQGKVENNIHFITEPLLETYPIWMKSDVFVRPSCVDGDSLSIREAMHFKIPVITSDAVPRPDGVILFKNRDVQDFIEKTKHILDNYERYKNYAINMDPGNGFDNLMEVYNELAE